MNRVRDLYFQAEQEEQKEIVYCIEYLARVKRVIKMSDSIEKYNLELEKADNEEILEYAKKNGYKGVIE